MEENALERQVTLKNTCEGLVEGSLLERFAKKLGDGTEITLTPKEAKRLVIYLNSLRHGFTATAPMICTAEQCPYSSKCPLGTNNTYPIGKECPIESSIIEMWYADYVKELGIDPDSKVDGALVGDLVFWEILEKRATEELAKKPEIIQKNLAGFQQTNEGLKPVYRDEMNQIVHFLEKAQKQKLKIMNALIATREAKAKDVNRVMADPCYDSETELLTYDGWKYVEDITGEDFICSLDKDSFNISYEKPSMVYSNDYSGKMYSLKSWGPGIDLLVTPNHKLFTGDLEEAKDIFGRKEIRFFKNGNWNGKRKDFIILPELKSPSNGHHYPSKKIRMSDWLEFLGYYISEGAIVFNKRKDSKSGSYVVTFYQKNDEDRNKILEACRRVTDASICLTGHDGKTIRFCDKRLFEYLKPLGNKYKKHIPRWIFDLKKEALMHLFDALMLGDGRVNEDGGGSYYCTSSRQLKDDFQELLLKIGLSGTSYVKHRPGDKVWFKRDNRFIACTADHWRISVRYKFNDILVKKRKEEWVDYSGKIYCVEVPSHIIFVRRNGCVCWCGNSTYASKLLERARELTRMAADAGLIDVTPKEVKDEPVGDGQ